MLENRLLCELTTYRSQRMSISRGTYQQRWWQQAPILMRTCRRSPWIQQKN